MTTTVQSMVTDARELLDVAAQSHYTDAQLAQYVVEGVRRMYSVRPSSRYGEGVIDDQVFPTESAALLAFGVRVNEARWRQGIVYWAAGLAHEVGITDSVKLQMAQTLKKQADEVFMS